METTSVQSIYFELFKILMNLKRSVNLNKINLMNDF